MKSAISSIKMPGMIGTGWAISFMGSLPGGTIAFAVLQHAAIKGFWAAIFFSLGDVLIEMLFVRILLVALGWLDGKKSLLRVLDAISGVVLLILAIGSFRSAIYPDSGSQILLNDHMHPFVFGMVLRAIIPTLIPYWVGICVMLFSNGTMTRKAASYNRFVIGLGLGTFSAHLFYAFGGLFAKDLIVQWNVAVQWLLGLLFLMLAIGQIRKVLRKDPLTPA